MKRNQVNWIAGMCLSGMLMSGCQQKGDENPMNPVEKKAEAKAAESTAPKQVTTASGLKYEILQEGAGAGAAAGQTVSVHYTGWLENGTKFDSSLDRGQPFQFRLGGGQVIKGWDEGVAGMKAGEKRKLTIPSNLGYGSRGAGGVIPPNATLIFEVQMVSFN